MYGLDFDLNCERCLQLWVKYGAATAELRATAARPEREAAPARRRVEAVLIAMRAHETDAHPTTRAHGSGS
jgi:hypothetical protein